MNSSIMPLTEKCALKRPAQFIGTGLTTYINKLADISKANKNFDAVEDLLEDGLRKLFIEN